MLTLAALTFFNFWRRWLQIEVVVIVTQNLEMQITYIWGRQTCRKTVSSREPSFKFLFKSYYLNKLQRSIDEKVINDTNPHYIFLKLGQFPFFQLWIILNQSNSNQKLVPIKFFKTPCSTNSFGKERDGASYCKLPTDLKFEYKEINKDKSIFPWYWTGFKKKNEN